MDKKYIFFFRFLLLLLFFILARQVLDTFIVFITILNIGYNLWNELQFHL